jgi:hypothetical protein
MKSIGGPAWLRVLGCCKSSIPGFPRVVHEYPELDKDSTVRTPAGEGCNNKPGAVGPQLTGLREERCGFRAPEFVDTILPLPRSIVLPNSRFSHKEGGEWLS